MASPNVFSSFTNEAGDTAFIFGLCGASASTSGVAQGSPMLEAIATKSPYTRAWYKDMTSNNVGTLLNAAYDATNNVLYYVYNDTSTNVVFHAISGADGSDVYAPVTISTTQGTGDRPGAFSVANGIYAYLDWATMSTSTGLNILTLSTGALTTVASGVVDSSTFVSLYGQPIADAAGNLFALYSDGTNLNLYVITPAGTSPTATVPAVDAALALLATPTGTASNMVLSPQGTTTFFIVNPETLAIDQYDLSQVAAA